MNYYLLIKYFLYLTIFHLSLTIIVKGQQSEVIMDSHDKEVIDLNYLLHLPDSYNEEGKDRWPLILFLHGIGERGDSLNLVKIHGIPKIVDKDKAFPFITISPQCPLSSDWRNPETQFSVIKLLENVLENYKVDKDRVYITGLSMGGFGTWAIIAKRPELFAAAAPICGGGNPNDALVIKNMPIWVFHGAKDDIIIPEESERMVKALERENGKVKFTLYPEAYHDSWTKTYENKELYDWFLSKRKK